MLRPAALVVAALIAVLSACPPATAAATDDDEPPLAPAEADAGGEAQASSTAQLAAALAELGVTGSLRAGYWASDRDLDDLRNIATAQAWLKLDRKLSSAIGVFAEGYLAYQDLFKDPIDTLRLREAYVDLRSGPLDLRLGKQIIAWGRTDRLNPTDNLTPRDLTLLVPEVDEDRFGSLAARASWNFEAGLSLTGIGLGQFQPNVLPQPSTPGVESVQNVPSSYDQWAVKLDQSGGDIDWSISYFDGFDLNPDLSPGQGRPGVSIVNLDYHRTRVLGADAATTRGYYRFAAELAYTSTEDPQGTNPFIRNAFWYGVFGVERGFTGDLSAIVQVFARYVDDYSNPEDIVDPATRALAVRQAVLSNQYLRTQAGVSVRIAKKWLNQTLEGDIAGTALLNQNGYALRSKLSYAVSDQLKVIGGFDWYQGSDTTIFGALERNSTLYAEVRYYF